MVVQMRCVNPDCSAVGRSFQGSFDATFRARLDGHEKHIFNVPGVLCIACQQLFLEHSLIAALDIDGYRCTFAIASDSGLRAT